jgi:hypothetical protein
MTLQEKLEKLMFQNKTKDELIQETITSLSGLLADTFDGDDSNELKKEFPENLHIEELGIELNSVSIHLHSNEFDVPCVEVSIELTEEKQKLELGSYSLIFNEKCEQTDEILNLV